MKKTRTFWRHLILKHKMCVFCVRSFLIGKVYTDLIRFRSNSINPFSQPVVTTMPNIRMGRPNAIVRKYMFLCCSLTPSLVREREFSLIGMAQFSFFLYLCRHHMFLWLFTQTQCDGSLFVFLADVVWGHGAAMPFSSRSKFKIQKVYSTLTYNPNNRICI